MKRKFFETGVLVFAICSFFLIFITGCAKSPTVKEEIVPTQGESEAVSSEQAGQAEWTETTEAEKRALAEKTLKEKILAEASSFNDIYFAFDRYDLAPESRGTLDNLADWLLEHRDFEVTIEGHCDERGTTEYNLALGERRAEAAKNYLVNLGINKKDITTISYGEELPLDPRQCEEAWSKNRRDHFVVSPKNK